MTTAVLDLKYSGRALLTIQRPNPPSHSTISVIYNGNVTQHHLKKKEIILGSNPGGALVIHYSMDEAWTDQQANWPSQQGRER